MKKKNYLNTIKKQFSKLNFLSGFSLPEEIKKYIFGLIFCLAAIIFALSFFDKAGIAGKFIFKTFFLISGSTLFLFPLIFILAGIIFFFSKYQNFLKPLFLAVFVLILGASGFLGVLKPELKQGGWLGYIISLPLLKLFGFWVSIIICWSLIFLANLIFWYLAKQPTPKINLLENEKQPSLIRRIFVPHFKVKEVEPKLSSVSIEKEQKFGREMVPELKSQPTESFGGLKSKYQMPPFDLLNAERGQPSAGDIKQNSLIIKKTLESFEVPVEMSEVNIGPTVTQYTLKPADGIKLSKITGLSNDLALSLAAHPIRIEAPIPGKSLVGVEVPNKVRTVVRLKDLIESPQFQNSPSSLSFCLGRDVSGTPVYADLARMPHLLVAGSTGSGKTIFLNDLILSLLYRNSPEDLRVILIDPKRVEFLIYNGLSHLLAPVIVDSQKSVNALKWLIVEMERRFGVLAEVKARDINSYNEQAVKNKIAKLPFIILIIDELADLMAARGKEIEASIVRLAQMARAVGIHLVVATQRPSVEVITGLIKANVTSRVAFQVASQVDSRTILDMAGAEKLLGWGDMLFISAEISKPKRIQGAYVSDKEVKKVVGWINSNFKERIEEFEASQIGEEALENHLAEDLEKSLEAPLNDFDNYSGDDDILYEEARRVVIENRRASASLLQRKLRIGYARAARLIDILEEKGVVGPSQGAKPREVYINEV